MPTHPRHEYLDTVKDLLIQALGERLAPGVPDYLDLFADDAVLETPYGLPDSRTRVVGRTDLAVFVESLRGYVELSDMTLRADYPSADGVVVLEYDGTVRQPERGLTFDQRYIAVIHTRAGRVTVFREYSDPSRVELAESRQTAGRAG